MAAIDRNRVLGLLKAGDEARTAKERGRAYEDLGAYIFEAITGVQVGKRNAINVFGDEELDLLLRNQRFAEGLREFPELILVECKNWSKKVGSDEVRWFADKLSDRGQRFGVLIAAKGITGDFNTSPNAGAFQLMWALKGGREIHVLLRDEIERLESGEQLRELLIAKRLELVASGRLYEAGPELPEPLPDQQVRRGRRPIQEVIRAERAKCIREVVERKASAAEQDAAWQRLRHEQSAVNAQPNNEQLWPALREALATYGRQCSPLGVDDDDDRLSDPDWIVNSVVDQVTPVWSATPTSEEWVALAEYYREGLSSEQSVVRTRSALSLVGLCADAMFLIDNAETEHSHDV